MGQSARYSAINAAPLAVTYFRGEWLVLQPKHVYQLADSAAGGNESDPIIVYNVVGRRRELIAAVTTAEKLGRRELGVTGEFLLRGTVVRKKRA